jgi:hypothetical protein
MRIGLAYGIVPVDNRGQFLRSVGLAVGAPQPGQWKLTSAEARVVLATAACEPLDFRADFAVLQRRLPHNLPIVIVPESKNPRTWLTLLAPDIVEAILDWRQPAQLHLDGLLRELLYGGRAVGGASGRLATETSWAHAGFELGGTSAMSIYQDIETATYG